MAFGFQQKAISGGWTGLTPMANSRDGRSQGGERLGEPGYRWFQKGRKWASIYPLALYPPPPNTPIMRSM